MATSALSTGRFSVSGGSLIGPNGQPFVARGIDVMAFNEPSLSQLQGDFPGINFVRLAIYDFASPSALSSYVNQLTAAGIVVELEDHTTSTGSNSGGGQGTIFGGQQLTNELNWYSSVAAAFKSNPYVWFGTNNEPSQTNPATGQTDPGALSDWQLATYNAVRGSGDNSPILLETTGWANGSQAIMNQGFKASDYAGMTNTVWDVHYYGWWTNGSADQATNNAMLASAASQAQQITSADGTMPVIIGEYGDSTTGVAIDSNADQVIAAVQQSGLGAAAWAWGTGNPGDGLTTGSGGLSSYGQTVANWIATNPPPVAPPVAPPATPNAAISAASGGSITDAAGTSWTIKAGVVDSNGSPAGFSANVTELALVNGTIWQENNSGLWWSWNGTGWVGGNGSSTAPSGLPSLSGAAVLPGSGKAITDSAGNVWTVTSGGVVNENGSAAGYSANVRELAYVNGTLWHENTGHLWWSWSGNGWTGGSATSPLPPDTLTLRMSEDAYQGDAQFTVSVDGQQVGGVLTASALHAAGDSNVFMLTGNWDQGVHDVKVQFLNDAYGGSASTDRNLYVSSMAYDGSTYTGTNAALMSNGAKDFTVGGGSAAAAAPADTLILHLSEDAWSGDAKFTLSIDGQTITTAQSVTASHGAGAWQDLIFSGSLGTGSHDVGITFTNDAYGGSASMDRNLYVNGVDFDGTHYGTGVTSMRQSGTAHFTV